MQTHVTPGAGAGLAPDAIDLTPPIDQSAVFCNAWRGARALTVGKFVPTKPSSFLGDSACPSFLIVNHDREGKERPEWSRVRYDESHPNCPKRNDGKPAKYKIASAPGFSPLFAPLPDSYKRFAEAKEKWIAEGEGQTLALAGLGLPVIGIGGCDNWRTKGTDDLHADFQDIRPGDRVYIAGEKDVRTNSGVRRGYDGLVLALRLRGAIPSYVLLPEDAGPKAGIDDAMAQWKQSDLDPLQELAKLRRVTELNTLDDFDFTTYDELIARPFPEWIVEGLVAPGELTAIIGATGCGKSFLTLDLLSAVARGRPDWFGHDINAHGLVVHLAMEGRGLDNRMKAYRQHHEITEAFPYVALERSVSLPDQAETDRLIRSIKNASMKMAQRTVLIAVDTVNRALGGGDENSSQDMGAFVRAADRIRDAFPACGVLLVHHLGKNPAAGARGHSSFSASVGGELLIEDKGGIRTLSVTKQRDGTTDLTFNFRLKPVEIGTNRKGKPITSCVVEASTGPVPVTNTSRTVYGWIHAWWVTQYGSRPVTKNVVKEQHGLITQGKAKRRDVEDAMLWAINEGLASEVDRMKNNPVYALGPPREEKF